MKTISMMRRRPDMTLAQFVKHYEGVHAPMGYTHYRFLKYVRNYTQDVIRGAFEFDAIVEFYPDVEHPAPPPSEAVNKDFADDRALFMDTKRAGGQVEETILAGGPRGIDPENMPKLALLIGNEADLDAAGRQVAARLAGDAEVARITIDRFRDTNPPQPCAAIIWLWTARQASDVLGRIGEIPHLVAAIEMRSYETPRDLLSGGRA